MRKLSLALFICVLMPAGSLYAVCKTDACKRAVAWKNGYTAVILQDDITRNDYLAVLGAITANKGAVAIESERVFLGWVPKAATGTIKQTRGVKAVVYEAVARPDTLTKSEESRALLGFFNRVQSGDYEDVIEIGLANPGAPLTSCIKQRPGQQASVVTNETSTPVTIMDAVAVVDEHGHVETANSTQFPITPNFWFRTPYQNPNMRGRVTVQVFRLDSDGTIDPNLYTWSSADFTEAFWQAWGAFNFWANEAYARGVTLSFRVKIADILSRYTRQFVPTKTKYEPITRTSGEDYLWMNDALTIYGYGASPVTQENVYIKNDEFNAYWRNDPSYGPFDASFTAYIVYNPPPAPVVFADGYRAYAFFDGPHTMVMWDSGGWGPQNLGLVMTHEAGHIFWACDEYTSGCFTCDHCFYNVGPRNQLQTPWIRNANCEYPGTACDIPRVGCMMRDLTVGLCPHTPGQVGW